MRELHLFSGAGGGILGGILLGHTCVCAVEIEPYRRQSMLQRQRDGIFPQFPIWDDVRTFDGKPWCGRVDAVCGGFPCQDISVAGKGEGITGKRSGLWKEMARIIRDVQPGIVFVENSAALIVRGLGTVLGDLASMGFDARWGVLGAADAIWFEGTPVFDHERNRCFIAATNANRLRELQSQGSIENERGWIGHGSAKTSNPHKKRLVNSRYSEKVQANPNGNYSPFERFRSRKSDQTIATHSAWWADEPGVGRMVHGMANRTDRIDAVGDGQVPAVVALAWKTLMP